MLQYIDFQVITNSYGVIFDVPAALLEVLFKINSPDTVKFPSISATFSILTGAFTTKSLSKVVVPNTLRSLTITLFDF